MPPVLIAIVLGAGLLALLPTLRLARRTDDRVRLGLFFAALWLTLVAAALLPPARRLAIPLIVALAVAPWVQLPTGLSRLLARPRTERRPPPRNVTPPEAGGPFEP